MYSRNVVCASGKGLEINATVGNKPLNACHDVTESDLLFTLFEFMFKYLVLTQEDQSLLLFSH